MATASDDKTARVVDVTTGKELIRIHASAVYVVAVSPDGRYLATASVGKTAWVVETSTGKELIQITHEGHVHAVAFSPDGRYLATAIFNPDSEDDTARVVETKTGKELLRVTHEGYVGAVAFSSDSGVLYTLAVNEKVAIPHRHLLRAENLITATCARLTRNLTPEEWTRYLGDTPYRKTCDHLGFRKE